MGIDYDACVSSYCLGLCVQGIDEHTAGGEYIFAPGAAYGACHAVCRQVVAQRYHPLLVAGREGRVRQHSRINCRRVA